jgi:hypothetical protein
MVRDKVRAELPRVELALAYTRLMRKSISICGSLCLFQILARMPSIILAQSRLPLLKEEIFAAKEVYFRLRIRREGEGS